MATASDILAQLDPREIRERLDELDRERQALMTLLRAARQRKCCAATSSLSQQSEDHRR
jgi:hypothetical protein